MSKTFDPNNPFADLDTGEFDGELAVPDAPIRAFPDPDSPNAPKPKFEGERHACEKCDGSGVVTWGYRYVRTGKCFKCNGSGFFKTSPAARREARIRRANNKVRKADKWFAAHPEITAWMLQSAPTFDFAQSLHDAVVQYGSLTDGQLAAAEKCVAKVARFKAERDAPRTADTQVTWAATLIGAFDTARATGLKRLRLIIGDLTFSPAAPGSTNPGCLYVKDGAQYLGKITPAGGFFKVRECTPEHVAELESIGADPLAAALLHGQQTGQCSCCGRELTNPDSIERGIGPICAARWGW